MAHEVIALRGNKGVRKADMRARVARGQGPQVVRTMQKMGWQQAQGPAAAVVVTLEGTDGTKIQGSQWVVKGKLEEVRLNGAEMWGKGEFEVVLKNLNWSQFSFANKNASMKPQNMSRWMDGLDMGMEVIKQGGEV